MTKTRPSRTPLLISFSGLDGAGKSTQIENLRALLRSRGLRSRVLAFWDDVVVLTRYRESFVHRIFKSERGIGAPGKPVNRRDKNVRGWHVSLARHALYLLDALNLRRVLAHARRGGPPLLQRGLSRQGGEIPDVIIIDRYIYDELANLPLDNPLTRAFVRFIAALAPRPDLAYMLDADPYSARARKPEYPLEFLRDSRRRYHRLATIVPMAVIPPLTLPEATAAVERAFLEVWQERGGIVAAPTSGTQPSAA